MNRIWLVMLAFSGLLIPLAAHSADEVDGAKRLAAVAPFLDDQTLAIGHVDIARLDPAAIAEFFTGIMPAGEGAAEAKQEIAKTGARFKEFQQEVIKSGVKEVYLVVSLADIPESSPFLVAPLATGGDATEFQKLLPPGLKFETARTMGKASVLGSKRTLERLTTLKPKARPEFAAAFMAAGETTAQLVIAPSADNRRVLREMLPRLPEEIGGSGTVIADGLQWAAIGVDAPPQLDVKGAIQSKDEESAAALRNMIVRALDQLTKLEGLREGPLAQSEVAKLATLVTPELHGDRLTLAINNDNGGTAMIVAALAAPLQAARQAAQRARSMNNLKQLALAMHNYHDTHKHFPSRVTQSKAGKPLLSWRVQLLPFLEANPLYEQFHQDEPWDSEHNRKLIEKMPAVFASPSLPADIAAKGMTSYVAPYFLAPLVDGQGKARPQTIFDSIAGTRFQKITDGTSNTIMILEANPKNAVVWTKPDDLPIDLADPLKGLKGQKSKGFNAAFGDGSVRFISDSIDPELLRKLFTMDGGEVTGNF
jgi:hypothetical protein